MSVAENPMTEQTPRSLQKQCAIGSAIGAIALVAGAWIILAGVPLLWSWIWSTLWADNPDLLKNVFLIDALLIMIDLAVTGGLVVAAYRVLQLHNQPGLRAGMVFGAIYLFVTLWVGLWIGRLLAPEFSGDNEAVGLVLTALVFAAFIGGAGYVYLMLPGWQRFLEAVEHQGWFHANSYKGNQGVRVRRGTIIGVLAVGVSGIITLAMHKSFGAERPDPTQARVMLSNDWAWDVPFAVPAREIPLMFKVHLMMPIVLGLLLVWIAWRVVNIPFFADFLIATEAEMNKVSWTSRRRLIQDTIVVLVTVFLFTTYLFVIDVVWIKVLTAPYIQVLLSDPKEAQQKQQDTAKW